MSIHDIINEINITSKTQCPSCSGTDEHDKTIPAGLSHRHPFWECCKMMKIIGVWFGNRGRFSVVTTEEEKKVSLWRRGLSSVGQDYRILDCAINTVQEWFYQLQKHRDIFGVLYEMPSITRRTCSPRMRSTGKSPDTQWLQKCQWTGTFCVILNFEETSSSWN